jgi:hypothetical protein
MTRLVMCTLTRETIQKRITHMKEKLRKTCHVYNVHQTYSSMEKGIPHTKNMAELATRETIEKIVLQ